jgi:hypothetical protein
MEDRLFMVLVGEVFHAEVDVGSPLEADVDADVVFGALLRLHRVIIPFLHRFR